MLRYRLAAALACLALVLASSPARAEAAAPAAPGIGIAIADFAYIDTSGEPEDQTAAHRARLAAFMAALRRDVAAAGQYRLVPLACGETCVEDTPPADLLRAATEAGARILVVGGIHKQSTLIEWATFEPNAGAGNRVLLDRLFTFRGDSDEAWRRAEAFISDEIRAALAAVPAAADPIALALFDFELEDMSAGASPTGDTPADRSQLTTVTNDVRELFAKSGRYRLVDVAGADAPEAKAHTLHDCNGCEAAIAAKLGAEQSFVGVVRRISRTEYLVRFQIRDARTGAVLAEGDSGLRMGADYSWNRGAIRLVKDRVLEKRDQP